MYEVTLFNHNTNNQECLYQSGNIKEVMGFARKEAQKRGFRASQIVRKEFYDLFDPSFKKWYPFEDYTLVVKNK